MACARAKSYRLPARTAKEKAPVLRPGLCFLAWTRRSQPIEDLIGPETREPVQRLVERRELVVADAADLLHRAHVLLVELLDSVAHLDALIGQLVADRAASDTRALMVEKTHLDQLLQIVGDVRPEIVAARTQLSGRQLLVAAIVEQERLHRIDVRTAPAIELVLDDVEKPAMKPLDQRQGFELKRTNLTDTLGAIGRLGGLCRFG